jgi:uncharacterized phage-associated protein
MYKNRFNIEKALEVLLYIGARCPNTYNALKVLYFADKLHLAEYGRFICGDSYVAMNNGPVPSGVYDMVKSVRGDGFISTEIPLTDAFAVDGYNILPLRGANLDLLSESEIECLDEAIKRYGHLSFSTLKRLSHDKAYKAADQNDTISLDAIVSSLPDSDLLSDYLRGE